jgi:hypothetical protein
LFSRAKGECAKARLQCTNLWLDEMRMSAGDTHCWCEERSGCTVAEVEKCTVEQSGSMRARENGTQMHEVTQSKVSAARYGAFRCADLEESERRGVRVVSCRCLKLTDARTRDQPDKHRFYALTSYTF